MMSVVMSVLLYAAETCRNLQRIFSCDEKNTLEASHMKCQRYTGFSISLTQKYAVSTRTGLSHTMEFIIRRSLFSIRPHSWAQTWASSTRCLTLSSRPGITTKRQNDLYEVYTDIPSSFSHFITCNICSSMI